MWVHRLQRHRDRAVERVEDGREPGVAGGGGAARRIWTRAPIMRNWGIERMSLMINYLASQPGGGRRRGRRRDEVVPGE